MEMRFSISHRSGCSCDRPFSLRNTLEAELLEDGLEEGLEEVTDAGGVAADRNELLVEDCVLVECAMELSDGRRIYSGVPRPLTGLPR